jgi:hypothetical protein
MSPVAALRVNADQGSARRHLREILAGCARECADRPRWGARRDEADQIAR